MSMLTAGFPAANDSLYLSELSPKDIKWDAKKAQSLATADLYELAEYTNIVARIRGCTGYLGFALEPLPGSDEQAFKLRDARFCRVRHCSICQWRRQLMWLARIKTHLPRILADYPKHKFIFLTLTVRNCPLTELRSTLKTMSYAWVKLTMRKQFPAKGWLRNVEVTRGQDDYAHPHYHALLMVPTTYFRGDHYLSQKKWTELWRSCMRLDYDPIVHVQAIKPDYAHKLEPIPQASQPYAHKTFDPLHGENSDSIDSTSHARNLQYHESANLSKAIFYCLKYSVKPDTFLENAHDPEVNSQWLAELTRQMHKTRAIALGGIFRDYMSEDEPEELIHADIETEDNADMESENVEFIYAHKERRFVHGEIPTWYERRADMEIKSPKGQKKPTVQLTA